MGDIFFKSKVKDLLTIGILFFYIDFIYFVNTFIWDSITRYFANDQNVISFWILPLPVGAVLLSILLFIVLFFGIYFYFQDNVKIEEANRILIISALLLGVKKFYCLKCMFMATFVTMTFLGPALFSLQVAYFLAKYIKKKNSLSYY